MPDCPRFDDANKSLLAKHLRQDIWDALAATRDAVGFPFESAIASGLTHADSTVGVYAGSADSYRAFGPLFDPIIADYHGCTAHRPAVDAGLVPQLSSKARRAVRSTRMRVARNLRGFPLGPAITQSQRREVQQLVVQALESLPGDLAGTYQPLDGMEERERERLVAKHLLFKQGDRFMESAGFNRDWPEARGMFSNADNTVLVWVNEEDHLRIISMDAGGDVPAIYARLQRIHDELAKHLDFAVDSRWGAISSCPTNLGTGLRASVHVHLPYLPAQQRIDIAKREHVQVRGIHGEHTASEGHVYDVSNRRRLGFSERQLVRDMVQGVQALVDADQAHG